VSFRQVAHSVGTEEAEVAEASFFLGGPKRLGLNKLKALEVRTWQRPGGYGDPQTADSTQFASRLKKGILAHRKRSEAAIGFLVPRQIGSVHAQPWTFAECRLKRFRDPLPLDKHLAHHRVYGVVHLKA
jgi:hypothetical protein